MSIAFESEEVQLQKLRGHLRPRCMRSRRNLWQSHSLRLERALEFHLALPRRSNIFGVNGGNETILMSWVPTPFRRIAFSRLGA